MEIEPEWEGPLGEPGDSEEVRVSEEQHTPPPGQISVLSPFSRAGIVIII